MKITIDTKEDSHEDIRKVMEILGHFTGRRDGNVSNHSTPNAAPEDNSGFMNMFGDSSAPAESVPTAQSGYSSESSTTAVPAANQGTAPDFSAFLNLAQQPEEKKDDKPSVEFF